MGTLLECKDLTKSFSGKTAIDHIDLSIESGHIIGLLGPNGSGKTTLIKMINGLLTPTSGTLYYKENPIGVESKRHISYLPDHSYLNMNQRVKEIIAFFQDFYEDFDSERAYDMLQKLNINPNDSLKSMSKGTKEKVQLILVMSRKAELYILDEPIAGVDPAARDYILDVILTNYDPSSFHPDFNAPDCRYRKHFRPGYFYSERTDPSLILCGRYPRRGGEIRRCTVPGGIQMLGKLFKYEFKNTYKLMFIIYGVMAFVTILGCIAMYGDSDPAGTENQLQEIFFTAAMVFYVLGVFALFVVSYVYMCVHFYKTMYSDQGYLTHTLPVGQMSIFNVKLLVSLCWLMLSLIIMFVSIFALGCAANRGFSFDADFDMLMVDFQNLFGMSLHTFSIYMIFAMILSCLQYLLMVFASGSIGQLFTKHKVGASIGAGIVFYMSGQIVSSIILVLTGYFGVMNNVNVVTYNATENVTFSTTVSSMLFSGSLFSIIECVIFYIVCMVIIKKHLNLE